MAVAQLKAVLGLDNAKYKAGIKDSRSATNKLGAELKSVASSMGVAFSVAGISMATKKIVGFASEIRHTADNLKVSTDGLQALNASALKYGVSIDGLNKMLSRLRQSQGKVADGDAEYKDALTALGIETEKFIAADTETALELIASAYAAAGDSAQAFSAVTDLLGRSGKNATAFLEELADVGLQGIIDQGKDAGSVMEEQLITKLELLGTRLEQTQLKVMVFFGTIIDGASRAAQAIGAQLGSAFEDIKNQNFGARDAIDIAVATSPVGLLASALGVDLAKEGGLVDRARQAGGEAIIDPAKKGDLAGDGVAGGGSDIVGDALSVSETDVAKIRNRTEALRRAQLEGLERLRADYLASVAEINAQLVDLDNKELKSVISERLRVLKAGYEKDVKEFKNAAIEKADAENKRLAASKASEQEAQMRTVEAAARRKLQEENALAGITGEGASVPQIQRLGGRVGAVRGPGLAQADREFRKLQEIKDRADDDVRLQEIANSLLDDVVRSIRGDRV